MRTRDICALPVIGIAADPCVLLLWASWALLPDALQVIEAWGFVYKSGFPWIKVQGAPTLRLFGDEAFVPTYGTGYWVRGCSEPILIASRGKGPGPRIGDVGILSERFQHSRKPENLYEYAENFAGPYLELFARRSRVGWDAWGDQAPMRMEGG